MNKEKNRYSNLFILFQELVNSFSCSFFKSFFEALDKQFRNSKERKEKYVINKSNVERTLITIFGTINFHRTLYQDKRTGEDKLESNKKKWIMSKVFVTFTGIHRKGKRSRLIGRHVFITSSNTPWKDFMNEIDKIYNFEKLENINLLSDSGSWILSGASEMKLYTNNKITINTCEFHVKQKINRSTTDKDLRQTSKGPTHNKKDS